MINNFYQTQIHFNILSIQLNIIDFNHFESRNRYIVNAGKEYLYYKGFSLELVKFGVRYI